MHFIDSVLKRHGPLVNTIAALLIIVALLFLGVELMRSWVASVRKRRARRRPPAPSQAPEVSRLAIEPSTPEERADRESSPPDAAQICLLCQDDVEPDEPTFPYARILVGAKGDSDAGKKRSQNEDCFLLLPAHALFAVADGMGGHRGGKVASALAVDTIKRAFEDASFEAEFQCDAPIPSRGRELATALVKANRAVFNAAQADTELADMGTTLVAARFSPNKRRVYIGHVGDSRCYRFRDAKLTQITTDHTMRHLGLEGPHANDLFRAVGVEHNVVVDLVVDVPRPDDIYLLCSDGLPKMVSDERIEEALCHESDLEAAVYRLIELANDAGGRDNVTVVLVRVREPSQLEAGLSTEAAESAPDTGQIAPRKRQPTTDQAAPVIAARGPLR